MRGAIIRLTIIEWISEYDIGIAFIPFVRSLKVFKDVEKEGTGTASNIPLTIPFYFVKS